ncbi:hypothetical protein KJ365_01955 [Glaciecola sp. XM2]|jgi:hypothetical protein|uniref:hypothetical protein n=1 Tax=Glaciecola sp. XM2 TaxID=1914931 RepID=UPI001BDE76CE|nr:hypothetical protein [Glaciecola sp. XM2]MBT1449629.1 hypothetical protein [Glaciecola sp. XM2]
MKDEAHIQRMLNKEYEFDVKHVLVRARDLSGQNNWTLVQAILILILSALMLGFLFVYAFDIQDPDQVQALSHTQNALASLVINVVLAPLFAGISMLAITTARGQQAKAINVLSYVSYILPLGVATLLISIAMDIGMIMFILPAFYVFMATTFALPLIVDKGLTPISAIILSVRMVNAYLFPITTIFLIFVALMVGVVLTFGFAYIWVGPYFFNVRAVLYTELLCSNSEDAQLDIKNSGVFDA